MFDIIPPKAEYAFDIFVNFDFAPNPNIPPDVSNNSGFSS